MGEDTIPTAVIQGNPHFCDTSESPQGFRLGEALFPQQLKALGSQPRWAPGWSGAALRQGSTRVPRGSAVGDIT